MTKVLIKNHMKATQGFHETAEQDGATVEVSGSEATLIPPGGARVLHLDDVQLKMAQTLQHEGGITLMTKFTDEDAQAMGATPGHNPMLPAGADDGTRAVGTTAPIAGTVEALDAVAPGEEAGAAVTAAVERGLAAERPADVTPAKDGFDDMDDDVLREYLTNRDGKPPHHNLGRPKLLEAARTSPEAI